MTDNIIDIKHRKPAKFSVGDVVRLKSGGLPMTVAQILDTGVVVVYFCVEGCMESFLLNEVLVRCDV